MLDPVSIDERPLGNERELPSWEVSHDFIDANPGVFFGEASLYAVGYQLLF